MMRKAVVILQAVLLGVLVFQVHALAECKDDLCSAWVSECNSPEYGSPQCHNHASDTWHFDDECCCMTSTECCQMHCWFYACYQGSTHTGMQEPACGNDRVVRGDVRVPPEPACGLGNTQCHN